MGIRVRTRVLEKQVPSSLPGEQIASCQVAEQRKGNSPVRLRGKGKTVLEVFAHPGSLCPLGCLSILLG
jgi:hypothetical protein